MSRISIATPQEAVPVDRARMREVVRTVLAGEQVADAEISLAFVDNPTIHRLNQRYLRHDEPTDVLSFPLSEPGVKRLAGGAGRGRGGGRGPGGGPRPRRAGGTGPLRHPRPAAPLRLRRPRRRRRRGPARARAA